jgi:hypothetical protein
VDSALQPGAFAAGTESSVDLRRFFLPSFSKDVFPYLFVAFFD